MMSHIISTPHNQISASRLLLRSKKKQKKVSSSLCVSQVHVSWKQQQMDFCSLFIGGVLPPSLSVASIRPLSHDPLPMSWPPEATGGGGSGEEEGAGFRWHARAELLTALLATASPPLALLQPASSSCHGSQVSPASPPSHSPTHSQTYSLT